MSSISHYSIEGHINGTNYDLEQRYEFSKSHPIFLPSTLELGNRFPLQGELYRQEDSVSGNVQIERFPKFDFNSTQGFLYITTKKNWLHSILPRLFPKKSIPTIQLAITTNEQDEDSDIVQHAFLKKFRNHDTLEGDYRGSWAFLKQEESQALLEAQYAEPKKAYDYFYSKIALEKELYGIHIKLFKIESTRVREKQPELESIF